MNPYIAMTAYAVFVWAGPLEVIVQRSGGAAVLSWEHLPFAVAVWDERRLASFQITGACPAGAQLRAAMGAAEAALADPPPLAPDPRELATWDAIEEIGELLRGAVQAWSLSALWLALDALHGPRPIGGVVLALNEGAAVAGAARAFLQGIAVAVDEVLAASVANWAITPAAPQRKACAAPRPKAKRSPRRPRPKKAKRIRFAETWF